MAKPKTGKIPMIDDTRFDRLAIWQATRLSVLGWLQLTADETNDKLKRLSRKAYVMDLEITHADLVAFVHGAQDKTLRKLLPNPTKQAKAALAITIDSVLERMNHGIVALTERQIKTSLAELKRMVPESNVKYDEACVFAGRIIGKAVIIKLLGYN